MPTGLIPNRLGAYGQREAASVLVPGTLMLIEAWLFWFSPEDAEKAGGYLQLASDQIEDVRDWVLFAVLALGLLAAYTLGILGRMAAWWLFDRYRKSRFKTGVSVRKQFEDEHGADAVERALAGHEALREALNRQGHDPFFQYAKLWLRQYRPLLAVETHEAEINFLIAIQIPLFLATGVAWRHGGVIPFVVTLAAAVGIAWLLRRKALGRSNDETLDVMRNFLFAQWYGETPPAELRPAPAAPEPAPTGKG